jgi:NADH dehydrogenase [ubiquinone] 1 alpha subcomplex assembly factor 7
MGGPQPVRLVELGPGRGTLMADVLRAARQVPAFAAALDIHLVERSPALRAIQKDILAAAEPGRPIRWHDTLEAVPDGPVLLLANEFLDALPIRQAEHTPDGWRWRQVGLAEDTDAFLFVAGPPLSDGDRAALGAAVAAAPVGTIAETSPAVEAAVAEIAGRLAGHGGAALLIDYGHADGGFGESLQAVRDHAPAPPLAEPGTVDLTAHVDFLRVAETARGAGAAVHGPRPQGRFLAALGAEHRARTLMTSATPEQALLIDSGVRRLIHPSEMGTLFKVIALSHPGLPPPPGFEGPIRP